MTSSGSSEDDRPLTIEIDRLACMGTGTCVEIAPDLFVIRDDNRADLIAGAVPDETAAVAAANGCPTFAITVLRGDDYLS